MCKRKRWRQELLNLNRLNNNKGCGIRFLLNAVAFSFVAGAVRENYRLVASTDPQSISEKSRLLGCGKGGVRKF